MEQIPSKDLIDAGVIATVLPQPVFVSDFPECTGEAHVVRRHVFETAEAAIESLKQQNGLPGKLFVYDTRYDTRIGDDRDNRPGVYIRAYCKKCPCP